MDLFEEEIYSIDIKGDVMDNLFGYGVVVYNEVYDVRSRKVVSEYRIKEVEDEVGFQSHHAVCDCLDNVGPGSLCGGEKVLGNDQELS